MNRFVILIHDWPVLHWDFLLEAGTSLRSWRLLDEPVPGRRMIAAKPLPPHRLAYLDYEGPISGGRGVVSHWDRGTYEFVTNPGGELTISLRGRRIQGTVLQTQTGFDFSQVTCSKP